jgi:hypothetical protein
MKNQTIKKDQKNLLAGIRNHPYVVPKIFIQKNPNVAQKLISNYPNVWQKNTQGKKIGKS